MKQSDSFFKGGKSSGFSRRDFIRSSALLGVFGMGSYKNLSAGEPTGSSNPTGLPTRGNYIFHNVQILSMDPEIGDLEDADVHVKDGEIIDVGKGLNVDGAEIISGKGMILLPGFVETHWHIWTSLLRSMAVASPGKGYFETTRKYGPIFQPHHMAAATRLSAAEAVFSGITTVHDWCHNVRSLQHAEASLEALRNSGIRARYSFGNAVGRGAEEAIDFDPLYKLYQDWAYYNPENLFQLGFAWRGIGGHRKVGELDLLRARDLGLPISVHSSSEGIIRNLVRAGLLGPDMQIIHGMQATTREIADLVDAGASISISPFSELRIGYGFPPLPELLKAGATIGLSVDTTTLSGNADMFAIMKAVINITAAMEKDEFVLKPKKVLEMATIEGAKSMGMDHLIGSITPGKRADLILVNSRALNLQPFTDPVSLLVEAAQPHNVDTVMVDGRILKREGRMVAFSQEEIIQEAAEAYQTLLEKVKE
jgi:5-methylthioadenosine/S-adenosylhomocysteine deaminase